eukprot:NODE_975_length_1115_cov_355.222326_g674_i0.p1 GENE.NODE_975_length_1115_cov_355.222326_g674_i0~~NODE_975_length_1115_cov_355.222326_g674_i0.p1  ORF type:complete len:166 (-),score=41.47 NODE_975_length_1115_cov_355.222326_g674_i0:436-933(-)
MMTEDLKLDVNNFLYYTSLWSAASIGPLALYWDFELFMLQIQEHAALLAFMVGLTSVLAFLNNATLLLCIKFTSGTYSGVVGNVKIIMIIIAQQLLWPEDARELRMINWFGMVLTIGSFSLLTCSKVSKPRADEGRERDRTPSPSLLREKRGPAEEAIAVEVVLV